MAKMFTIMMLLAVSAVFVLSGLMKVQDIEAFIDTIRRFELPIGRLGIVIGLWLPWLEIMIGIGVYTQRLKHPSLVIMTVLSLIFVLIQLSVVWRGMDVPCGCFGSGGYKGSVNDVVGVGTIARSILLALASGTLLRIESQANNTQCADIKNQDSIA